MAVALHAGPNHFDTPTGAPGIGYRLYAYIPSTSTPKDTFTNSAGTIPNTHPVVADALGNMVIYWDGAYDVVLRDENDALIWGPERLEDAAGDLEERLADPSSASNGDALIGVQRTETGAAATTLHIWIQRQKIHLGDFAGLVGDGVADDSTAIQNALNASEGKSILTPKDCIFLLNDELLMQANSDWDLAGSIFNSNVTGAKYGIKAANNTRVFNGQVHHVNTTNESGVNASHRACLTAGSFNAGPAVGNINVHWHDLVCSSARPDGTVLGVYADSRGVHIERVQLDGTSKACKNGITLHYGLRISSPAAPGDVLHPWGVVGRNIVCTNLQVGIYLAGAYDVDFNSPTNYFSGCTRAIEVYRGDQGKAYAAADVEPFVGKKIFVGGSGREIAEGLRVDGIQGLVGVEAPYLEVEGKLEFRGRATGTTSDYGATALGCKRLDISGSNLTGFDGDGVLLQEDTSGFLMNGGSLTGNAQYGFRTLNLSTIQNIAVRNVLIAGNAHDNSASVKPGVLIGAGVQDYTFDGCSFGVAGGSETQNCSIAYDELSVRPTLINNRTYALASTGTPVAYQVLATGGLSTAQIWARTASLQQTFENNYAAPGLTLYSGLVFATYRGRTREISETSDPTAGVWGSGARRVRFPPLSGQAVATSALTTATDLGAAAQGGTRANTTAVSLGEWRRWSTGDTVWECTTAGTTAGAAPSIVGIAIGGTVVDGTVTWTKRADNCITTWASEGNLP